MSLLLAIHSWPGANERVARHWPFYEKSGAAKIMGIGTTDGGCKWPEGVEHVEIGQNSYIQGDILPRRLVNTMRFMMLLPYDHFCIIEWDCLFFQPMPRFSGFAAFHAGNSLPGMKAKRFHHVPWAWDYETGQAFVKQADRMLKDVEGHECSPDMFLGWVCETAGIEVHQPWVGFSRNSLDNPADVELARDAYQNGAVAIHGIKNEKELRRILE